MSLRAAASQESFAHSKICNFLRKELGRFSYKLEMVTSLTEDHKMRRKIYLNIVEESLEIKHGTWKEFISV